MGEGFQALIHALLLDQAFLISNERNYWHTPSFLFTKDFVLDSLEADQIKIIDQIALLMHEPETHINKLQYLYDSNSFLHTEKRLIDNYYEKISGKH